MTSFVKTNGEIHLGDLIQALGDLPWQDEAQAQAIAACLGFGFATPVLPSPEPDKRIFRPETPSPTVPSQARSPEYATPAAPPLPVSLPDHRLTTHLQLLDEMVAVAGEDHPAWLDEEPQVLAAPAQEGVISPPRASLIPNTLARGLFGAALATLCVGTELGYHRLLFQMARGRIPAELPRLATPTLKRGCHLFMDFSPTMLPWWDDLHDLLQQIRSLLGRESVRAFKFDRNPLAAKPWLSRGQTPPWQLVPGQPVLVATDLGVQSDLSAVLAPAGWHEFVQLCADADCPLLILCPWPSQYWPSDLGGHPFLIHWHKHTSAARVRRRVGPGHQVST